MDAILWGLGIGVIGGFFYILVNRLRWRREQAQQDAEVQQRRAEREAYGGFNARVQTATAEEIAQAEKDRRDFFSLLRDKSYFFYAGTALYNNAQEQAILEEARRAAKDTNGSLKNGPQTCSYRKWGTITAAEAAGTVTPEQRTAAEMLRRQSFGGTPDPKEYRP